jgi:flagellar basal body-associated protein FliL
MSAVNILLIVLGAIFFVSMVGLLRWSNSEKKNEGSDANGQKTSAQ